MSDCYHGLATVVQDFVPVVKTAQQLSKQALDKAPNFAEALIIQGRTKAWLASQNCLQQAEELITRALTLKPPLMASLVNFAQHRKWLPTRELSNFVELSVMVGLGNDHPKVTYEISKNFLSRCGNYCL